MQDDLFYRNAALNAITESRNAALNAITEMVERVRANGPSSLSESSPRPEDDVALALMVALTQPVDRFGSEERIGAFTDAAIGPSEKLAESMAALAVSKLWR